MAQQKEYFGLMKKEIEKHLQQFLFYIVFSQLKLGELTFGQARFSVYNSFGQLIRENNKALDKIIIYNYNETGNGCFY